MIFWGLKFKAARFYGQKQLLKIVCLKITNNTVNSLLSLLLEREVEQRIKNKTTTVYYDFRIYAHIARTFIPQLNTLADL